jgi:hypothetical protein
VRGGGRQTGSGHEETVDRLAEGDRPVSQARRRLSAKERQ